jgi:hypothetical protein
VGAVQERQTGTKAADRYKDHREILTGPPLLLGTPVAEEKCMSTTPPPPYTPPAELLEKAAKELEHAAPEEVAGAQRAYEAYNAAVGGRSAATGAPLPTWEQNPNALVKYGWLAVHRQEMKSATREVEAFFSNHQEAHKEALLEVLVDGRLLRVFDPSFVGLCRRLAEQHAPDAAELLIKALSRHATKCAEESAAEMSGRQRTAAEKAFADPYLKKVFDADFLELCRKWAAAGDGRAVESLHRGLVNMAQLSKKQEAELAELRLDLGAVHNTLAQDGALTAEHERLLEAAAMRMEAVGFAASGEFLRACAAGAFQVEEPKASECKGGMGVAGGGMDEAKEPKE